jgi:hypothetical protein
VALLQGSRFHISAYLELHCSSSGPRVLRITIPRRKTSWKMNSGKLLGSNKQTGPQPLVNEAPKPCLELSPTPSKVHLAQIEYFRISPTILVYGRIPYKFLPFSLLIARLLYP